MEINPLTNGVLHVISADGNTVHGEKRFQKLVFILSHKYGVPLPFDFHDDRFGPFSGNLRDYIRDLSRRGLITCDEVSQEHIYSLTEEGKEIVSKTEYLQLPSELFRKTTEQLVKLSYEVREGLKKIKF